MELGDPSSWRKNPLRRTDSNASTIMRLEAARARVASRESKLLGARASPLIGGAGSGAGGAGAGSREGTAGLEHILTAKSSRGDGASLWGAESVRSVLTDVSTVDRSIPSVVIDHGSACVSVACRVIASVATVPSSLVRAGLPPQ